MSDPRHRLYRPVVGERALRPRVVVEKVAAMDREVEIRTALPVHKEARSTEVRPPRQTREPGPYVPKLIRLIRRRFALVPSSRREHHAVGVSRDRAERVAFGFVFRETVAALPELRLPRATDVHPRLEARLRLSADAWLRQVGGR